MFLQVQHLSKSFESETVIHDLSFGLEAEQTLSILGQSGCGKTTLLKIIAGLLQEDSGEILLNGERINAIPAQKRGIVYLYQETLLFPHLNVFENVAFGLRLRKGAEKDIRSKTMEMIRSLGLEDKRDKMPDQLSGGQKQRVSFGRALIVKPSLLLLDEPFGNLDTDTRTDMQRLFREVARAFRISSVFVTHDLKEAILMGDHIGRMKAGRLQLFPDLKTFIQDKESGIGDEIRFWKGLDEKE
jgi:ABC-type Fe3+/spermidine/putrescine transport system ATPase subunit